MSLEGNGGSANAGGGGGAGGIDGVVATMENTVRQTARLSYQL